MKLKKLFVLALVAFGFASCENFLEVESPSKYDDEYIFTKTSEIERALNGVYAQLLNGNTYGNYYLANLCLNSDVDMWTSGTETATDDSYRRFDSTPLGSAGSKAWNAAYMGVEYANNFIAHLAQSPIYNNEDEDVQAELDQMMGEAKVLRAIFYHDLVVLWGDIPFSLNSVSEADDNKALLLPVTDRTEIHKQLIDDLKEASEKMKFASEIANGVERISKEAAWTMIARMALTAGGYSLRPDTANPKNYGTMERPSNYKEFYQTAMEYAQKVIDSGTHTLGKAYNKVFIDECNYIVTSNDDPIFEIPFAKNSTGSIGYIHGPSGAVYEGASVAPNIWGASNGGACLSAFYRFFFDPADKRRDFVNGLWDYTYDGIPNLRNHLTVRNNKWSKFWGPSLGAESAGNTGINYPLMRYADVLLMYAEAANEINEGPTAEAVEALRQVRMRAFGDAAKVEEYLAEVQGSKEDFLKAVLDERKLEFGGENMRWRDLVRNNLYSEAIFYSFLRYFGVAEGMSSGSMYTEMVSVYDGKAEDFYDNLPYHIYYKPTTVENDGVTHTNNNPQNVDIYPNTTLDIIEFYPNCLYQSELNTGQYVDYQLADFFVNSSWYDEGEGMPSTSIRYSFYGFMRTDAVGRIGIVKNGALETINPVGYDVAQLPVVRYILPYPNDVIQRGGGVYKNYYGY